MSGPLTGSIVTYASTIKDLLDTNKNALGLRRTFYGDQTMIPDTPVACVEPTIKNNELRRSGASRMLDPTLECSVIIYHSIVGPTETTRLECDTFGEVVETFLNAQVNLGGIVIHCYVTTLESGYVVKSSKTYNACRLTVRALTQVILPNLS